MKKHSIQIIGSINMDLVVTVPNFPKEGETISGTSFSTFPGGKGANQAVAVSRLGANTTFIGCVGIDDFGKQLIQNLRNEKVSIKRVRFSPSTPTGTAVILIDKNAHNQIIVTPGANHALTQKHLDFAWRTLKEKPDALLLQFEIPINLVVRAAELAKRNKTIVILNPAPAQKIPLKLFSMVDFIIPNQHEAEFISGTNDMKKAGKWFIERGVQNCIITLGKDGALFTSSSQQFAVAGVKVKAVDPTAAGDAFIAAFTLEYLRTKSIDTAIRLGNAAGAYAATIKGAHSSLPNLEKIKELIKLTRINKALVDKL